MFYDTLQEYHLYGYAEHTLQSKRSWLWSEFIPGRTASSQPCDLVTPTNSKSQIALKYIELSTVSMVEMT